jgi:4-amino-4-deoxy-L-arabinose transferase-like glycosyltransferase
MNRELKIIFFIVAGAGIFYIPFIGNLHLFDWDEINFAEAAREMLVTGDYLTVQIFFEPFWEKPPLFIWLQAASMHLFGVNEFAARFPNAIAGVLTLFVLYRLGKRMENERFGIIWAVAYGASILPFMYFKSGIIDPWFNLFIFLGVAYYIFAQQASAARLKYTRIIWSASFLGLAILTKGPAALLIFGLTIVVLLLLAKFKLHLRFGHVLVYILTVSFVGGFWFLLMIFNGNWDTVVEFVVYQKRLFQTEDAGHGGFLLYHFVIILFGVFPATGFALMAHRRKTGFKPEVDQFRVGMLVLLWVVLILFTIVKTKILHYSSLCYFPVSFLAAYAVFHVLKSKRKLPLWLAGFQTFTAVVFSLAIIFLPIFDKYKQWFIDTGKITHSFTIGNLQADPGWQGWEWITGVILLIGTIWAVTYLRRGKQQLGLIIQAAASTIFMFFTIVVITPKVEKFSQNSAIEFMKSMRGKDVYVETLYKSYAKFFYPQTRNLNEQHPFMQYWETEWQKHYPDKKKGHKDFYFTKWLTSGAIDKPVYFIVRKDKLEENLKRYKELELIEEKNGYVF